MFAVIESGGKQYRVEPGDVLDVELLGEGVRGAGKGAAVSFERVLAVSSARSEKGGEAKQGAAEGRQEAGLLLGQPLVEGALVRASLVGPSAGPKLRVFKTKRRNTQRRTRGHRQHYHRVRIEEIQLPGGHEEGGRRETE